MTATFALSRSAAAVALAAAMLVQLSAASAEEQQPRKPAGLDTMTTQSIAAPMAGEAADKCTGVNDAACRLADDKASSYPVNALEGMKLGF